MLANIENNSICADSTWNIESFLCNLSKTGIFMFFQQIVSRQIVVDTLKRFGTFFGTNVFGKPHGLLKTVLP